MINTSISHDDDVIEISNESHVTHCLIINMDKRTDLWYGLKQFRKEWTTEKRICHRITGTDYTTNDNVLNHFIQTDRIDLNGSGFRQSSQAFLGELGCYTSHYDCWKYIVDNDLPCSLILEDGITILRNDYHNLTVDNNADLLYVNEEMQTNADDKFVGYGLQGYVVTNKGATKLMNLCSKIKAPIDLQIRHLCNTDEIRASVISVPFVKRNHDRVSSIEGRLLNDQEDLNAKQSQYSVIQRIMMNLLQQNVNLDNYM
jgi:GR25 family glycosyltransferase involved in LPS biosynthesis